MRYFFDTEFIEDGKTIDLISLGMVAEDGRTLYIQNVECNFSAASDWIWRNVFPQLRHFDMRGKRLCWERKESYDSGLGTRTTTTCGDRADDPCPWAKRREIMEKILAFCDPAVYGKPEFWGYYADYDWVVFCQLFGRMIELPKVFPKYCRDLKQLCDSVGNPPLPDCVGEHHALADAEWNKEIYEFLTNKPK